MISPKGQERNQGQITQSSLEHQVVIKLNQRLQLQEKVDFFKCVYCNGPKALFWLSLFGRGIMIEVFFSLPESKAQKVRL